MIYIQSNTEKTLPHHFDCACALYGAIDSNINYKLITYTDLITGKFDNLIKTNLFVGSVEFMREVFNRIGLIDVRLPLNSNRQFEILTLEEAHNKVKTGSTIFIKPLEIKLFTGLILDGIEYSCLKGLPNDTKVLCYEPFKSKIESEWRIYVYNHKVVDSRNYSGDCFVNPNYRYITNVVNTNKVIFPSTYTIDVGILFSEENVVIEYNDMWAIGNYGMPNDLYLSLLKSRYFEIINGKNVSANN